MTFRERHLNKSCVKLRKRSMLLVRRCWILPRGKELEQLPMANTLPGMGQDKSKMNRNELTGMVEGTSPQPAKGTKKQK